MKRILSLFFVISLFSYAYSFAEDKDIVIRVVCPTNQEGGNGFEKIIRLKSEDVKRLHKEDKHISRKLNDKAIVVNSKDIDDLDEKILNEELKSIEKKKDRYRYSAERVRRFRVDDGYEGESSSVDDEIDKLLMEEEEPIKNKKANKPKRKPAPNPEPKVPKQITTIFDDPNRPKCETSDCDYLVQYDIYKKVMEYKDLLELTKKQISLIEVYHIELLNKSKKIKEEIDRLQKQLDNMVLQPVRPRVEEIKVLLIRIAKQKLNLSVLNIKEALIIKKVLTPKQWKMLVKLIKQ